jgi:pyrroloquinoline-quinone synthase
MVKTELTSDSFAARLAAVGNSRYHDKHPFQRAMHDGVLTRAQIQGWVSNRYYYQKNIPVKDAAILSHLPDREKRRQWIKRIIDHDGTLEAGGGGIESWFVLAEAVGLSREDVASEQQVVAGTRFAVDAYVTFARTQPWLSSVASSLTELFAGEVMSRRIQVLSEKYPWIEPRGLDYFKKRLMLAPSDAEYAMRWVVENATTPKLQDACVGALEFKCDVLWGILDATMLAFGAGPGARPSP